MLRDCGTAVTFAKTLVASDLRVLAIELERGKATNFLLLVYFGVMMTVEEALRIRLEFMADFKAGLPPRHANSMQLFHATELLAAEFEKLGTVLITPVANCVYRGSDGCCMHPKSNSAECHQFVNCPEIKK